jgi:hypothetical protein
MEDSGYPECFTFYALYSDLHAARACEQLAYIPFVAVPIGENFPGWSRYRDAASARV